MPRTVHLELAEREAKSVLRAIELQRDVDETNGVRDTLRQDRGVAALAAAEQKIKAALEEAA